LSRLLGAVIGFLWSLSLVSAIMAFCVLARIDKPFFKKAKKLSEESYLYNFIENRFLSSYPLFKTLKRFYENPEIALQPSSTPIKIEDAMSMEDMEAVRQDEKLQAILADEGIKKMVEEKDIGRLLSNPKIQDLLQDRAFVKKLIKLYNGMVSEQ